MKVLTLKSCDTCRKALSFLDESGFELENHDIRQDGLSEQTIRQVVAAAGWEKAVNKRSTTWRKLNEEQKDNLDDDKAVGLIQLHPTLMKRPVFFVKGAVLVGFDNAVQAELARHFG